LVPWFLVRCFCPPFLWHARGSLLSFFFGFFPLLVLRERMGQVGLWRRGNYAPVGGCGATVSYDDEDVVRCAGVYSRASILIPMGVAAISARTGH
jgi:hypothetical protein